MEDVLLLVMGTGAGSSMESGVRGESCGAKVSRMNSRDQLGQSLCRFSAIFRPFSAIFRRFRRFSAVFRRFSAGFGVKVGENLKGKTSSIIEGIVQVAQVRRRQELGTCGGWKPLDCVGTGPVLKVC